MGHDTKNIEISSLKISLLNMSRLKSATRRAALFYFLESLYCSIFFSQECGIDHSPNYEDIKKDWPLGPSIWSGDYENKDTGVGILVRGPDIQV